MNNFKFKIYLNRRKIFIILCLVISLNTYLIAQPMPANPLETAAAVGKLRDFYQKRDYEGGYEFGRKAVERFPENSELQAWFIVNTARNEMSGEAVKAAEKLIEKDNKNEWAWFAAANAYIRNLQRDEALSASRKALELNPGNEDFILLFASALLMNRKYDEIYTFLDKNSSKIKDQSRLLVMKAEAQYRQSADGKKDEAKKALSFKTFAKAQALSPDSVNTNYVYGVYLIYDNRYTEAYLPLKNAAVLTPEVASVRNDFWKAVLNGQPLKSEDRKKSEVAADINKLISLRPDSVKNLEIISVFCGDFAMPEKRSEVDGIILLKFPQTAQAERILIRQIKSFNYIGENGKADEQKRLRLIQMLKDFIVRPKHFDETYLVESYSNLFYHTKNNKNISDAEFLQIAEDVGNSQQILPDVGYSMIVEALIERKMFLEAEKFVGIGFEKVKNKTGAQSGLNAGDKASERNADEMNANFHSISGWLFFNEGRLNEAEKELETAAALGSENLLTFNRLGQVYEAENKFDKAENAYIKGYASFPSANELNFKAINTLYKKRGEKAEDFQTYFEKIKVVERETRKTRIISAKLKAPKNVSLFTLKNLDDKIVSLTDSKNKIVVINFWGTWCAPCVRETPEMQEFYKKYAKDKDVAILTINNDEDAAKVQKFMNDRKFNFPVLRGDNYVEDAGITAFPTTWFINRNGQIIYQTNFSDKLVEEFTWRVEELKK